MNLFGIGPMEILLILVVALIILGPAKVPEIGRKVGRAVRALRKVTSDFSAQVSKEMKEEENNHPPAQRRKNNTQTGKSVERRR